MTNTYNQKQKPNKNKIIIKIANFINYKLTNKYYYLNTF